MTQETDRVIVTLSSQLYPSEVIRSRGAFTVRLSSEKLTTDVTILGREFIERLLWRKYKQERVHDG
jgi:hypothetical protein